MSDELLVAERSCLSNTNTFEFTPRKKRISIVQRQFLACSRGILRNTFKKSRGLSRKQVRAVQRHSVHAKPPTKHNGEESDADVLNINEPIDFSELDRRKSRGRLLQLSTRKPRVNQTLQIAVPDTVPENSINTVKRIVRVIQHPEPGKFVSIGTQTDFDKPKSVSVGIQWGTPSLQIQKERPIPQVVVDRPPPPIKSYWTHQPNQFRSVHSRNSPTHTVTSGGSNIVLQPQQQYQYQNTQQQYQQQNTQWVYQTQPLPVNQIPQQQHYTGKQKKNFIKKQRSVMRRANRQ